MDPRSGFSALSNGVATPAAPSIVFLVSVLPRVGMLDVIGPHTIRQFARKLVGRGICLRSAKEKERLWISI